MNNAHLNIWRRKWQPTPVFLPGESQGQRSLVDCRLQGCTESDTTEVTQQQRHLPGPGTSWALLEAKQQRAPVFLQQRLLHHSTVLSVFAQGSRGPVPILVREMTSIPKGTCEVAGHGM